MVTLRRSEMSCVNIYSMRRHMKGMNGVSYLKNPEFWMALGFVLVAASARYDDVVMFAIGCIMTTIALVWYGSQKFRQRGEK